jgi:formamidopyrimidine-DNA glycosylase
LPELPEVETVVRSIRHRVTGQKIVSAEVSSKRVTRNGLNETISGLSGAVIQSVRRHGKQIFFDLDRGVLYIHLGMTGKLLWNTTPTKFARAILYLEDGTLIYDDVRQFGRFEFHAEIPANVSRIGPDALQVTFEDFYSRLQKHSGFIKPVLLNQSVIGGVGNIYADEALFASRIHPRAISNRISRTRAQELHKNIVAILALAVEHRGSSISNYVDSDGACGNYQQQHNAYGRDGEACPRCGKTIRRVVLGQRGTHYCPGCQRV